MIKKITVFNLKPFFLMLTHLFCSLKATAFNTFRFFVLTVNYKPVK